MGSIIIKKYAGGKRFMARYGTTVEGKYRYSSKSFKTREEAEAFLELNAPRDLRYKNESKKEISFFGTDLNNSE
jgi:hypothetical protein